MRRRMERSSVFAQTDDNVTCSNGWILNYLAHHEGEDIFQKDIENTFCIRRSTVSQVLRLMESKGLVRREVVPYDARLKKLVLTPEGKRIQIAIEKEQREAEQLLRQGVTDEELSMFFQIMEKFKKNVQ
jgi:DNA-binding MarR family transcriptional regulator